MMWEELKKTLLDLKNPYVYLWAIASPAITLLSPNNSIKVWLFIILVLITTLYWLIERHKKYRRIKPTSTPEQYLAAIRYAVAKAIDYLENAKNKNIHHQRYRNAPSIMETSTVFGALNLGKHFLGKDHENNERGLAWLFETLKSQFSGVTLPDKIQGFDCPHCRGKNQCNVAFFDYLSHFGYCRSTPLFASFVEQFSLLGVLLKKRLISGELAGWPAKEGDTDIDPLASATALHLCLIFNSLDSSETRRAVNCLIWSQQEDGSWKRPEAASNFCGGEFNIISTHRVIETLSMCLDRTGMVDLTARIKQTIAKGAEFLSNCPLTEVPVSYDLHAGYVAPEVFRSIGHVAQGLTKAGNLKSVVLRERISYLLNNQQDDGSFPISNNVITSDRDLIFYSDVTSFLIRTLVFYANALIAEQNSSKNHASWMLK